ncbi:hypothetical protein ACWIGW_41520 [Nocardia brasiliensis]
MNPVEEYKQIYRRLALVDSSYEIGRGFGPQRATEAICRINRLHAQNRIADHGLHYGLATLVLYASHFAETHPWRALTDAKRDDNCYYYRQLGRPMAIKNFPDPYTELATRPPEVVSIEDRGIPLADRGVR